MSEAPSFPKKPGRLRRFFSKLGPGLITGAADDDPSGVATYSIVGAQLGTSMLWTAVLTWPLMGCVQFMCARIGMVTGEGLASALVKKLPRPLLIVFTIALLVANTINVAADLAGMSDAAEMLTGLDSHVFVVLFGLGIGYATIKFRYVQIAKILKWLSLVLFAYVLTAFTIGPDWRTVLHDTFIPTWPTGHEGWASLVAILGTTISPYLFFWQSSQEVEEEKAKGLRTVSARMRASTQELHDRMLDVGVGTFVSNFVMYFIVLTCALTLHANGQKDIETTRQAAEALGPLAGWFAATLYTVGLVGVGLLAIPTLVGSSAYAFAETFGWRQGLDESYHAARPFYAIIIISTIAAMGLDFSAINPVQAMFWAAVLNGMLAPFMLAGILLVASDRELMQNQPSSALSRVVVAITTLAMFATAIALFLV